MDDDGRTREELLDENAALRQRLAQSEAWRQYGPPLGDEFFRTVLEAILEQASEEIIAVDARGQVILANPAAERLYGHSILCGQLWGSVVQTQVCHLNGTPCAPCDLPLLRSALDGEISANREYVVTRLNGERRATLVSSVPIRDAHGQIIGAVRLSRDITEQTQTEARLQTTVEELEISEEELRRSEERFRLALEHSPMAVYTTDRDLRVTWAYNPPGPDAAEHWLGLKLEELAPEGAASPVVALGHDVLSSGIGIRREITLRSADGIAHVYDMTAEPLRDAEGQLTGLTIAAIDLTERKQMEQALRALNEKLEARVATRTADLEDRTEQLRILAGVITQTEQRERRQLAQALHDGLQQLLVGARLKLRVLRGRSQEAIVAQNVQQIDDILEECLRASRLLTVQLSPSVLYELGLAAALGWLAQSTHDMYGLTVDLQCDTEAEPQEEDIRVLLFQCVRELLFNVVRHAGVDRVQVSMHRWDERMVEIVVSDRGAGFDPTQVLADRLLSGGSGIFGIRERLKLMGGEMEVDSAPGRGTCVALRAPLYHGRAALVAAAQAEPAGAAIAVAEAPGSECERMIGVLLADDHAVVRQGLANLLAMESDIEIVGQAGDGVEAVKLARELHPDVVVMDVSMPRLGGIEATRRILEELPRTRVIALSMHEEPALEAAMRAAGAVVYLHKGGPTELIVAAIHGR